tara:strand:+ start:284 stop:493 length:210 start_codon:yes stop_codon:yes gene_type:complete
MNFSHPKIGDFVKVKHTAAGIDCVALVTGELIYYNKDSASVPVLLSIPNKGDYKVTVHNTSVVIINENR